MWMAEYWLPLVNLQTRHSTMAIMKVIFVIVILAIHTDCNQVKSSTKVIIENTLEVERSFETVALTKDMLKAKDLSKIGLRNHKTGELQITQGVDNDGDKIFDELLFQPVIGPQSKEIFEVIVRAEKKVVDDEHCYSRFVPERTDDYAWENNRVAFRMFGPTAQKMKEDKIPGGTLTSGVDLWLKKVDHPIINKWYKKTVEGTGTYHEDTGEGLDNFHVGVSRGVGGVAVKKKEEYYFSKNFTKWRTITTGPIRTSFQLEYEAWDVDGQSIQESKTISLDYGSNLSKFETTIKGSDTISIGLTLHEKDGEVTSNSTNGWVSYWQPHSDSELGSAIIMSPEHFIGHEEYVTDARDLSHAYAHMKVENNKAVYYAGFGWRESGQYENEAEWSNYLNDFSLKMRRPLKITIDSN